RLRRTPALSRSRRPRRLPAIGAVGSPVPARSSSWATRSRSSETCRARPRSILRRSRASTAGRSSPRSPRGRSMGRAGHGRSRAREARAAADRAREAIALSPHRAGRVRGLLLLEGACELAGDPAARDAAARELARLAPERAELRSYVRSFSWRSPREYPGAEG